MMYMLPHNNNNSWCLGVKNKPLEHSTSHRNQVILSYSAMKSAVRGIMNIHM